MIDPLKRFIREVHRRSVWQVLGVYLVASWIALQVVDTLTGALQLPAWFPSLALVLLIIGLPIVLATAFVQEGIGRVPLGASAPDVARVEPGELGVGRLLTWPKALTGGVLAFAAFGVLAAGWVVFEGVTGESGGSDLASVAVLPFDNLSPEQDDRYIADGMHDEIIAQLSRIGSLRVISRTSVLEYRDSPKNVRVIGQELGVGSVLEGSVRRSGDQLRITLQLVDARTDANLWGKSYLEELAVENLFAVQEEVARSVTESLAASLSPDEAARLAHQPTTDLEAYNFYLRGNDYVLRDDSEEGLRIAQQMYERAIELDPGFALAHAELSRVHSLIYWYYFDRSESRAEAAHRAADLAVQLGPDRAETHRAMGWYLYRVRLDYEAALAALETARGLRPNESDLIFETGLIQRRQGRWDEAARNIERRVELNPRSAPDALQAGITFLYTKDYDRAERYFDRTIELAPDMIRPYVWKARVELSRSGDTASVRGLLEEAERIDPTALDNQAWWHWAMYRVLRDSPSSMMARLDALEMDPAMRHLARAEVLSRDGQAAAARLQYDSARVVLERRVEELPDDARFHSELGLAYAGLGLARDAVDAGARGVELMPVSGEALFGPDMVANLVHIHAMLGEPDRAVARLEALLALPNPISRHWLELDPIYDPLRGHPGFESLVRGDGALP